MKRSRSRTPPEIATVEELLHYARDPLTLVWARLPNGSYIRVTGHERLKLWDENPELKPSKVGMLYVDVADEDGAARLYDQFEHLLPPEMM
jgi:hypothetical protein